MEWRLILDHVHVCINTPQKHRVSYVIGYKKANLRYRMQDDSQAKHGIYGRKFLRGEGIS